MGWASWRRCESAPSNSNLKRWVLRWRAPSPHSPNLRMARAPACPGNKKGPKIGMPGCPSPSERGKPVRSMEGRTTHPIGCAVINVMTSRTSYKAQRLPRCAT
jgi:hypothetical protein